MKKIVIIISLGYLLLYTCVPTTISIPTVEGTSTKTAKPRLTETFTPTPPTLEPISGSWSTFYSPEFGFSLQYPAVLDKGFQSLEFTCNISIEKNTNNNLWVVIGDILVIGEKTEKNLTEYTNHYIENNRQGLEVKLTEIELDGLVATRLEYHQESPPRSGKVTILVKENKAITIEHFESNFFYCDLKDDGYSSYWIYERVVKSLKLLP